MGGKQRRRFLVAGMGVSQIITWGTTFYLLTVLANPIQADTGWNPALIVAGVSVGLVSAAVASPRAGWVIASGAGRRVLALSAAIVGIGLILVAVAPNVQLYLGAWAVIGVGMGGGLYSGAFAVLAQVFGDSARSAITTLTLFGGFASTVSWPLSAFLVDLWGWRWTVVAYAALNLLVAVPFYLVALPRHVVAPSATVAGVSVGPARRSNARALAILIGVGFTLSALVASSMAVHLLDFLGGAGLPMAVAVGLGMLVGPSQVAARFGELLMARKHSAVWTLIVATAAVALALAIFATGLSWFVPIVVLFGIGVGLGSIASGTVPLALLGAQDFARITGWIALPVLLAQAIGPVGTTVMIEHVGDSAALTVLACIATASLLVGVAVVLLARVRPRVPDGESLTPAADAVDPSPEFIA